VEEGAVAELGHKWGGGRGRASPGGGEWAGREENKIIGEIHLFFGRRVSLYLIHLHVMHPIPDQVAVLDD